VLCVIALHSLIEFPLWYTYFLGIAAVLAGVTTASPMRLDLRRLGAPLVGVVLLAGFAQASLLLRDFRSLERLVFAIYPTEAHVPGESVFREVLTGVYREPLLAPYVDAVIAHGIEVSEEQLPEKLDLVQRSMRFAPAPFIATRQALLLELAGERAAALAHLERALRVYPWEAKRTLPELEALAERHPGRFGALLELARSVARAPRRSHP
jgi:hypothetical protein